MWSRLRHAALAGRIWVRLIVMKWLTSVAGHSIGVTGRTWCTQDELLPSARRLGGKGNGRVTEDTTVLVRGRSGLWAYGDYGRKEKRAADLVRRGHTISVVHDSEFRNLLDGGRARLCDRIAGEPVQWLTRVTKRRFQAVARLEGPLDREHGLLVAAHIKPRSECTEDERLDFENVVFGLCVLGCDALYERGLVSVLREGEICIGGADKSRTLKSILRGFREKRCSAWKESAAHYFEWHATRRFQG